MNEDDKFAKLSAEDQAKLALLEQEFERDGPVAIERFAKNDPVAMLKMTECLSPKAVRDADIRSRRRRFGSASISRLAVPDLTA